MVYINTKENENRYRELCSRYASAMAMRNARIEVKKARVEVEEQMLKDIDREINELNATGKISHDVADKRNKLWSARTRAIENIRRAKDELNTAIVGEDHMREFKNIINRNS